MGMSYGGSQLGNSLLGQLSAQAQRAGSAPIPGSFCYGGQGFEQIQPRSLSYSERCERVFGRLKEDIGYWERKEIEI